MRSASQLLALVCCFSFSAVVVLGAHEQRANGSASPDALKETAWNTLLDAHETSLDKGREQKFLAAIQIFEEYLRVGPGDEVEILQQVILAHTELARVYERKKNKTAWQAQYRRAAEISEQIAENMAFPEATRAQALGSAVSFYAKSGDAEKLQQCQTRLRAVADKLPKNGFMIVEPTKEKH
jgi:hypothetical protein